LPGVARDASCGQSILREGHGLELVVRTNVEGVRWLARGPIDTIGNAIGTTIRWWGCSGVWVRVMWGSWWPKWRSTWTSTS